MADKNFSEFAEAPFTGGYLGGYNAASVGGEKKWPITGFALQSDLHDAVTVAGNGINLTGQAVSLNLGTGAAQVSSGTHTHAQLHDAVTIVGNGLALTGQAINLNFGLGSDQVSSGNHNHYLRTQLTYGATMTPDCADGFNRFIVMEGTGTINPPTNGTDGTILKLRILASGASRDLSFNASIKKPTGVTYTATIASGSTRIAELEHNGVAWMLIKNLEFAV